MKRYLYIYYLFFRFSLLEALAYRLNFVNSIFAHLVWAAFQFVSIILLTSKTKTVLGWSREELLLLTANFNLLMGIFRMMITQNLDQFAIIVHYGKLDQYLVKPVDSQFWVSLRRANIGSLVRIPVALIVSNYLLHLMKIELSIQQFLLFMFFLAIGMVILYSIWFMTMTLIIWFTNLLNLKDFLDNITGIIRYPREVFENTAFFYFLLFFPLSLVITVPTKYLLGKVEFYEIAYLCMVAVLLFSCARIFWKFALRYYTSASG